MSKAITLRLAPEEYERLEAEAKRRGVRPGTLAGAYVRAGLTRNTETEAERQRQRGLEALDRLVKLTADLPPVDAVQVAQASREQLEQRSIL